MERERDNDRESEMDKIKLQELQAKFDHSLEALWDSGPGNAGDKASIWAAPSLSIPSGPLWPVDPTELLILPIIHDDDDNDEDEDDDDDDDDVINDEDSSINCKKIINSCNNTPYFYNNHYHVSDDGTIADNGTVIPWDIGIIGVGKFIDDSKDKIDYNLNWSDYGGDGPWNWKDLGNNLITIDNPKINSFYSSPHDDINLIIKQQRQQKEQRQYLSATNDYKEKLNNLKNEIDGNKIINNDGGNFVELKLKNEQEQKQDVEAKVIEVIEDKEQVRIEAKNKASENVKVEQSEVEEEEDLLTSARTHFRPIKDDGNWVDGTTFPVNNNYESVNYRRSSCGNLLYLPNDDNPYMEYHETIIAPLSSSSASNTSTAAGDETAVRNFTLKFRVKQCDKSIQTDPIRSPVKRRIIAEPDRHFYYTKLINNLGDDDNGDSHADDDDDDDDDDNVNILTQESYDIDKDSFMLDHMHWKQPSLSLLNDRKRLVLLL
ncbi:hypothetical protein KQX54_020290 [Cotesia glomerata]|uniref:Uncharacterized protein n=1 Tax=Cotesia glomerata TaxID=32391 RepID=A0AAV7ING8_COTGL|nr:hypothetical protein KQX54_020290 [Cotesia glomerata]